MSIRNETSFSEIEPAFRERADNMVWCAVATMDTHGRPTNRVLHPIWDGDTGWILTYRNSVKRLHLAKNPYISLAYVSDAMHPAYVEAIAGWEEDAETRRRIWELFSSTPEPLGYDPTSMFQSPDHENTGLLRIEPWKITLATPGGDPWQIVWRKVNDDEAEDLD